MKAYKVFMDLDVHIFLGSLRRLERNNLIRRFEQLASFPETLVSSSCYDNERRLIDIHEFQRFAIYYWADHTDGHLRILRVVPITRC